MSETPVTLSIPDDLGERLDRYEAYMRRLNPAMPITRGAAIRALIHRALSEFENQAPRDPDRLRRLVRTGRVPYKKV